MSVSLEEFERQLRRRARLWSDFPVAQLGLQVVKVDGEIVRKALINNRTEAWLERLFQTLPDDATLIDIGNGLIWPEFASGSYRDRYCLIFGSEALPVLEDGADIPEFVAPIPNPSLSWTNLIRPSGEFETP